MVKKGKPKPAFIGKKKEKILTPATIALIALIIMVGSVIILPNTNGGEKTPAAPAQETWVDQILANAPPEKIPLNDSAIYAELNKSRTVVRFFYSPSDPTSKQAEGVLDELSRNRSMLIDRINFIAQCGPIGAESIKPYCPKQAPLAIIYLPNGQTFTYPGTIDKERTLVHLSGNFTPKIGYYGGQFSNLPPTAYLLVEILRGTAEERTASLQEAAEAGASTYPAAIVNRSDLNLQNYANALNQFITGNMGNLRVYAANDSIIISPNPHGLIAAACPNRTEIKFFFSPSMPTYGNESALLEGLQAEAKQVKVTKECLPTKQEDVDTCLQKYNQTNGPMEEAGKYSITSLPAYVINANCQYEYVIRKAFVQYGENASAELKKEACQFGNC